MPPAAVTGVLGNLELVRDVRLNITVELGRAQLPLKEVLQLGDGSLIKLDRLAGEPVDMVVNGRLVAQGEVVVIGNNFGVKITNVIRPSAPEGMDSQQPMNYDM
ncbi:MAG: flagellar motor switch protein FliN [Candidatus Sericytochromatia bacterium]|nr:flagellar motor switch protein FliN [Candidatus Sericytochromatia bacterium]